MLPSASTEDPVAYLQSALLKRRANNPAYSLRAFARDLGVSHCYLSQMLNRRMKLSLKQAVRFTQLLNLSERESQSFVSAAAREGYPLRRRRAAVPKSGFFILEIDRLKILSEWYHFAILDLTLTDSFRADPRWVARRLGLRTSEVRAAVNRLRRLGLLEIRDGRWVKTHAQLAVPTHQPEQAMRDLHRQFLRKALEELDSEGAADFNRRDITGTMIPINLKRLPEAKRRIARFRQNLLRFLSGGGPCQDLYQLNVQLFGLTAKRRRRPKRSI